jgi:hypothetical protein
MGKFFGWVVSWEQLGNHLVGDHKDKVSETDLITGKIVLASLFEILVEHLNGTLHSPFIAVNGRLDMLWVFVDEPGKLTIVHVLFGRLKLHPR